MDRDEVALHNAATRQGLILWRNDDDGTWGVGAAPAVAPLQPGSPVELYEALSADDVTMPDGRTFKLRMTTDELRAALGLEEADTPA